MVSIKGIVKMREVSTLKEHPQNEYYNSPLNEKEWTALKRSIEEIGIQDPLFISEDDVVIAGHHRLKIAEEIGLEKVPVRIVIGSEEDHIDLLLQSNNARRKQEKDVMKLARQALYYQKLFGIEHGNNGTSQSDKSYKDVAEKIGKSVATTNRLIRLNYLITEIQTLVSAGKIPLMAAVELSKLPESEQKMAYEKLLIDEKGTPKTQRKKDIEKLLNQDKQQDLQNRMKKLKNNIGKWKADLTTYAEVDFERPLKIDPIIQTLESLIKQIDQIEGVSHG